MRNRKNKVRECYKRNRKLEKSNKTQSSLRKNEKESKGKKGTVELEGKTKNKNMREVRKVGTERESTGHKNYVSSREIKKDTMKSKKTISH